MSEVVIDIGYAVLFCGVGGVVGVALVLGAAAIVPVIINRMTPHMDEAAEIARGNMAVAEYFGRIVSATIIGVSIVIAAAVLGGILAALH